MLIAKHEVKCENSIYTEQISKGQEDTLATSKNDKTYESFDFSKKKKNIKSQYYTKLQEKGCWQLPYVGMKGSEFATMKSATLPNCEVQSSLGLVTEHQ